MTYSKKEKTIIYVLGVLCILCFGLNTFLNVFGRVGMAKGYISLDVHSFSNPAYFLWWALTIILCMLFLLTLKGLFKGYNHKKISRRLFYFTALMILLVLIILFLPNYTPFMNLNLWITVDFLGIIYFFFYLIYIFNSNEG
ncbi:MAG: hypothetical protein GY756_24965 [bacterium]|nr:hypothetical protein [bacterium]